MKLFRLTAPIQAPYGTDVAYGFALSFSSDAIVRLIRDHESTLSVVLAPHIRLVDTEDIEAIEETRKDISSSPVHLRIFLGLDALPQSIQETIRESIDSPVAFRKLLLGDHSFEQPLIGCVACLTSPGFRHISTER